MAYFAPWRWLGCLVVTTFVLGLANRAAASPSARLIYVRNGGTESCPDENAVRSAVAARLGYDPFFPHAAETMFIELSKEKSGYRARVKLVDDKSNVRGTREIAERGSSCSGMIDTLAISISIAIDPDSLTRAPSSAPAPAIEPTPNEPAAPAPSEEPAPAMPAAPREEQTAPRTATPSSLHVEALFAPAVWISSGPPLAVGAELGARLRWPAVSVGLELRGDAPASRVVRNVDVTLGFFGGSFVACGHSTIFFACARATLGALTATSNASASRDDSTLRLLTGASVGTEIPVGASFQLLARAIGNVALGDQTIVLNRANVYDLPRLSAALEVGGVVRF